MDDGNLVGGICTIDMTTIEDLDLSPSRGLQRSQVLQLAHSEWVAQHLNTLVLGATGAGNIGALLPDDDPQWKDADSIQLLRTAYQEVQGRGFSFNQADITVIVERPRVAPYIAAMCQTLADALDCEPGAVSIKGKTNEGMGFIGRGEGVAVIAVATLETR